MSYVQINEEKTKEIQTILVDAVYGDNTMLQFFKRNKIIQPIPKGGSQYQYFKWDEMDTGQLKSGIVDLPIVDPILGPQTRQIVYFGLKVQINKQVVDNWANARNPIIGQEKDILASAMRQAVKPMNRTVSSFLAYGDNNINLRSDDILKGKGKFFGMFNSGQIFAAGGGDDKMHAYGDYIATTAKATGNLEENEFRARQYLIMSDKNTHEDAQFGNAGVHLPATGPNERDLVLQRKDIAGWAWRSRWYPYVTAASVYPTVKESRILYTIPRTPDGDLAYRLLQGYNFDILTAYGGNFDGNFNYVMGIVWSGVFDPLIVDTDDKAKAIQVSGPLDFDG